MYRLSSGSQRAGKGSRIMIGAVGNGTALNFASWDLTENTEELPTTNYESYNTTAGDSYDEGIHGPVELAIRFGGDWDAAANPFASAPGLFVRDDLANINFFINRLDNTYWYLQWMRVRTAHNSSDVHGKVLFDVTGKSQGLFTVTSTSVGGSGMNAGAG